MGSIAKNIVYDSVCIYIYVCMYIYIYMYVYVYVYVYVYIYIYTCKFTTYGIYHQHDDLMQHMDIFNGHFFGI